MCICLCSSGRSYVKEAFVDLCLFNPYADLDECMQILDMNPQLYFHLQQQKLIELIREGKTNEALEFAQEELAPRGEENVFNFLDLPLYFILVSGFRSNLFQTQLNLFKDTLCASFFLLPILQQTFLEEIEKTVALLIFKGVKNCPYRELLDVSQRLKTASEVNAAILASQSHGKDSKLPSLLKMLKWTQNHLDERAAYPAINDFTTAVVEDPSI
ncbi:LisH and RanBPM domains containing protein [Zea mays]|uniref:LisH and RanBPM domains containing protein n=1 Tax=Zea mays TaxID=4577 RepID=A0A1D6JVC9_MAIZE|nr:LisH and RanBPM domains containing protein [Zea mays]